ncbi:MAG: AAA family ATPase [Phycisphaerae bacterium]|nr:AAA family ATPase [Phycisphaerae bacterium]
MGNAVKAEPRLHRPIIHGLLREGETMNIIAAPKGKSWMSTDQAMAVALGNP